MLFRSPEPRVSTINQVAVGAKWLGEKGNREITLTKTGSLIDKVAGANVSNELSEEQRVKYLPLWRALLGESWLWVDATKSVGAYVGGELRMVGYLGEAPNEVNEDPFAKFRLTWTYSVSESSFICRETGEKLNEKSLDLVTAATIRRCRENLQTEDVIWCTWDGELICFNDEGPEFLGEVDSRSWFTGHFLVPTT